MKRATMAILTSLVWSACDETSDLPPSIPIDISVEADPGTPLGGVFVRVDGKPVGSSDSSGSLRTTVFGRPGQIVRLDHDCPEGHRAPDQTVVLRLRTYDINEPRSPIEVNLECRPQARLAVFVVRASNGANIPVLVDGEVVTRTNAEGVAHFSRSAPPGTEYLIELDAREHPGLGPRRAAHLITVPDSHELFVINQSFQERKTARSARSPRRRIIKIE